MLMMGKGDASAPLSCWLGSSHPNFMVQYSLVVVLVFNNLWNGRHDESQSNGCNRTKSKRASKKTAEFERYFLRSFHSFLHSYTV
jgi:hypothetical protein